MLRSEIRGPFNHLTSDVRVLGGEGQNGVRNVTRRDLAAVRRWADIDTRKPSRTRSPMGSLGRGLGCAFSSPKRLPRNNVESLGSDLVCAWDQGASACISVTSQADHDHLRK
jgi:hypothetical protein